MLYLCKVKLLIRFFLNLQKNINIFLSLPFNKTSVCHNWQLSNGIIVKREMQHIIKRAECFWQQKIMFNYSNSLLNYERMEFTFLSSWTRNYTKLTYYHIVEIMISPFCYFFTSNVKTLKVKNPRKRWFCFKVQKPHFSIALYFLFKWRIVWTVHSLGTKWR